MMLVLPCFFWIVIVQLKLFLIMIFLLRRMTLKGLELHLNINKNDNIVVRKFLISVGRFRYL